MNIEIISFMIIFMLNKIMTDSIFDLLGDAADRAKIERQTAMSREWFRKHIYKNYRNYTFAKLEKESRGKTRQRMGVGSMYSFQYDAKYAKELPYWDKFPLVIVLDISKDHMLGLNLHYLHPRTRGVILGKLLEITNNKRMDETTKLKLTYGMVKSISKYKLLKPCIKKYIKKRILSKLILIDADEFEMAVFLPTQRFLKKSDTEVWRESRKMVE